MKLEMFVGHHVDSGRLNPGSLEKQPVLLIEEPSLEPHKYSEIVSGILLHHQFESGFVIH